MKKNYLKEFDQFLKSNQENQSPLTGHISALDSCDPTYGLITLSRMVKGKVRGRTYWFNPIAEGVHNPQLGDEVEFNLEAPQTMVAVDVVSLVGRYKKAA